LTDSLTFEVDERFQTAAEDWGDARLMDFEDAMEAKAEQALLEIEHLVSDATEVEFAVDGSTVRHQPSDQLAEFLADQAEETGLAESEILKLHVDLFARVFLEDDAKRPPNAPPTDDG
jgi:hypothetical protein